MNSGLPWTKWVALPSSQKSMVLPSRVVHITARSYTFSSTPSQMKGENTSFLSQLGFNVGIQ